MPRPALLILVIVLLCLGCSGGPAARADLVGSSPILLATDDPERLAVGQLRFAGGIELRSRNPRFGGLSSMLLSPDGRRLTMLSDRGWRFEAELVHDAAGRLIGARAGGGALLPGLPGVRGRSRDSEAMARLPDGDVLVAFERKHAVLRYPEGWQNPPDTVPPPDGLEALAANGGLESIVALPDGRTLLIAEEGRGGESPAWIGTPGAWTEAIYVQHGDFRPTDAAVLPSGDVLVLERRFTWVGGVAIRIVRVPASTLRSGARIKGQAIGRLELPLTVDNFEAIAIYPLRPGEVAVYLLSDDNFSAFQRTLLMQFLLKDAS